MNMKYEKYEDEKDSKQSPQPAKQETCTADNCQTYPHWEKWT